MPAISNTKNVCEADASTQADKMEFRGCRAKRIRFCHESVSMLSAQTWKQQLATPGGLVVTIAVKIATRSGAADFSHINCF